MGYKDPADETGCSKEAVKTLQIQDGNESDLWSFCSLYANYNVLACERHSHQHHDGLQMPCQHQEVTLDGLTRGGALSFKEIPTPFPENS